MDKTKIIVRTIFYTIFFFLPVLGMMNCTGWNEGSGKVASCLIDGTFFRTYSELYYGFILLSAFWALLPLAIYAGISIGLTELVIYLIECIKGTKTLPIWHIFLFTVLFLIILMYSL